MKNFLRIMYITLICAVALLALSAAVFLPLRAEQHTLNCYLRLGLAAVAFDMGMLVAVGIMDLIWTKLCNKKIIAASLDFLTGQKKYVRFVALLSQALLTEDKITGKSRMFVKKIKQQTNLLADNLNETAAAIKRFGCKKLF